MNFYVKISPLDHSKGLFLIGHKVLPCALGQNGAKALKFEGDGASPIGSWHLQYLFFRPDKTVRPQTRLPMKEITLASGWCDAAFDRNYNRPVTLPYKARTESLWRNDNLYDIAVVLNHNTRPRIQNLGSAIFMHIAEPNYAPTEGCIALNKHDLNYVLRFATTNSSIKILP